MSVFTIVCLVLLGCVVLFFTVVVVCSYYFRDWPVHILEERRNLLKFALTEETDPEKIRKIEDALATIQKQFDEIEQFKRELHEKELIEYEVMMESTERRSSWW